MRLLAALFLMAGVFFPPAQPGAGQVDQPRPESSTTQDYLTVHNVRPVHDLTRGAEARVGILDHSFGQDVHPELYAGGSRFLPSSAQPGIGTEETHQGYWMALALHEVAPAADIFALDVIGSSEAETVAALERALDWAVEHDLDVVTYCSGALTATAREYLDPVVERTVAAGVVIVFVDYPHPMNLLPGGFSAPGTEPENTPDLNIFSYDCTALFADTFVALIESDDNGIQRHRPFLARPSTGSVTAGFVALLRSLDPEVSPASIKNILVQTSRPMVVRGLEGPKAPDAFSAVSRLRETGF